MKRRTLFWLLIGVAFLGCGGVASVANEPAANDPNAYTGTDSERIEQAVAAAPEFGGLVRIPARRPDADSPRTYWLLDRAILLPSNTTLLLENSVLKLSDKCRDNFIRSANAGPGIKKVEPLENIFVVGVGNARLEGADRPRATGDSGKLLGERTYGTDAGKDGESQTGDWRNIGVLFAKVKNFGIENLTVVNSHAWGISLEKCEFGRVARIAFDSTERREIDGKSTFTLNQDGVDLRKGCRNITIESIRGRTGDDLVALTAIGATARDGGSFDSTEVSESDPSANNDICDVVIRDVVGYSAGGHQIVRFLNASGIKIYRITLDSLTDTAPTPGYDRATIRIGDANPAWGGVTPVGDTFGFVIRNVHSSAKHAVLIAGSLTDSIIENIVNYNPAIAGVTFESGEENVRNVVIEEFVNVKRVAKTDAQER